jgi:hypothetical protein
LRDEQMRAGQLGPGGLRIPTKSAMHSNSKPATDSDFKPARYSDLMSAT